MLLVSYLCAGKPGVAQPSTRMDFPQLSVIGSLENLRSSTGNVKVALAKPPGCSVASPERNQELP